MSLVVQGSVGLHRQSDPLPDLPVYLQGKPMRIGARCQGRTAQPNVTTKRGVAGESGVRKLRLRVNSQRRKAIRSRRAARLRDRG